MSTAALRHVRKSAPTDSLARYLEEIGDYPLLGRNEEIELARRARAGDREAVERLVCANLRFVVSIAKRYRYCGLSLSDLINEGNVGLMRAVERFDETKGVKLISYAVWWIRQAMTRAIAESSQVVRTPTGAIATLRPLTSLSLDTPIGDDDDASLLDYLPDDGARAPDEDVTEDSLECSVGRALTCLRAREAKVLRLYFGFEGADGMTLEAIGEIMGITRERVRQIKDKALSRIKKSVHAAALESAR